MKKLILFICAIIVVSACRKQEITEVNEYTIVEEYFDNNLVSQIDTIMLTLDLENNHEVAFKNKEPNDSLSYIPKIFANIANGWVSMPCRAFTGPDMNYLTSYRVEMDSTYIYATEPNPFIPDEITREYMVVWLPVY